MIIEFLFNLLPSKPVFAHCDIPCGIYDPHMAQVAAKTVLTMVQKINELPKSYLPADATYQALPAGKPSAMPMAARQAGELQTINSLVRMVNVKEEHAELCKKEVLILWTDYFKAEHLEKFPDLHDLIWKTTKLCSDNKRGVDEEKAQELIKAVDKIAEIFEQTKAK